MTRREVFKDDQCARGRVARAPARAARTEEEGGKAINGGTEKHQREATRAGAARWTQTNRGSTARQRRTRARPHTDWGVERLQEWSAAARARPTSTLSKRTLTRWRRS